MRGAATDLPAGRELDALVAEKVMGEAVVEHGEEFLRNAEGLWGSRPKLTVLRPSHRPNAPDGMRRLKLPAYSTDIAAAWEVVERLLSRKMYPDLVSSNYPVVWTCEVDSYSDPEAATDPWPVKACADTAPLAICRAALAAVRARADSEPTP